MIRILVVGPPDFLTEETRHSALQLEVQLVGPYRIREVTDTHTDYGAIHGVIFDIDCDTEATFDLIERLDVDEIPSIFALRRRDAAEFSGAFSLSPERAELSAIVMALLGNGTAPVH